MPTKASVIFSSFNPHIEKKRLFLHYLSRLLCFSRNIKNDNTMTKKKEKKAGKHMRKSELANQLMTWMEMRPGEDFALKQIFRG